MYLIRGIRSHKYFSIPIEKFWDIWHYVTQHLWRQRVQSAWLISLPINQSGQTAERIMRLSLSSVFSMDSLQWRCHSAEHRSQWLSEPKKGVTQYYQHSQSPHTKIFFNATGWSQLAPLWPGCHVMCRLHEPKCSHVLRLFLALTCMVHGCGGSSSPWRGLPSWCFSSQHFNSGDFHWWALDVGCHARKWNTERKQALSKESNSFLFYFNLSNSLLLV